jgi:prophage regulatory protein
MAKDMSPALPDEGFVRLTSIIGDTKANPPIPALVPVSKSAWWAGIKSGKYPAGIKLGPKTTVWRIKDVRALFDPHSGAGA